GILRERRLLDHWIGLLRDGTTDDEARRLLQLGLFQLQFCRIPEHALVNETVNLSGRRRTMVNAVLRRAIREKQALDQEVLTISPAVRYSLPDFLFEKWIRQWTATDLEQLCQWNQKPAPVYLRLNDLRPAAAALDLTKLNLRPVHGQDGFFEASGEVPKELARQGNVYIQDPATRLAVDLLNPKPGETVVDAFASPGGKSAMLASKMKNAGQLLACDRPGKRFERLNHNLKTLGVDCARTLPIDWLKDPAPRIQADCLLADVPCSNTGVLRRRVDLRWRLSARAMTEFPQRQLAMMQKLAPLLKPEGRLVYSTCSLEPEENEQVVERFLAQHPNFALADTRSSQPHQSGYDGAFAALLHHRS
ncbi:MAG: RsmB/NOP family class I SAM-dependent RNA methyltransferase, partial [Verrucomicrobiota bacterium]